MLRALFEMVEAYPSSVAIRESLNAYPILLTSHVIGMCVFAGLVMICLLYTSPSPRDATLSRMPSSA